MEHQHKLVHQFDECLAAFTALAQLEYAIYLFQLFLTHNSARFPPLPFDAVKLDALLTSVRLAVASELYSILLHRSDLLSHLATLRATFLLGNGDFATALLNVVGKAQLLNPQISARHLGTRPFSRAKPFFPAQF